MTIIVKKNANNIVSYCNKKTKENIIFYCYNNLNNYGREIAISFIGDAIKCGVCLYKLNDKNVPFLYYVCKDENNNKFRDDILNLLINKFKNGLELNFCTEDTKESILYAYCGNENANYDIVNLMVEYGAKSDNHNPLEHYILSGGMKYPIIELLINRGYKVTNKIEKHLAYINYKLEKRITLLEAMYHA